MNNEAGAQISAFLDDELSERESKFVIRRLGRDAALRETVARYALIGAAARGAVAVVNLAPGVQQALNNAPPLAPARRPLRRLARPLAGLAVAASVAVVAVLTLQRGVDQVVSPSVTQTAADQTQSQPQAVSGGRQGGNDYTVPDPNEADLGQRAPLQAMPVRLNRYIVTHSDYSTIMRRKGLLGYAGVGHFTAGDARQRFEQPQFRTTASEREE